MSITYGILKATTCNGMIRHTKLSSGYDIAKARLRRDELNRIQRPKNNEKLSIMYHIIVDCS